MELIHQHSKGMHYQSSDAANVFRLGFVTVYFERRNLHCISQLSAKSVKKTTQLVYKLEAAKRNTFQSYFREVSDDQRDVIGKELWNLSPL